MAAPGRPFPEAGATIADFVLVEELGRGAFAVCFWPGSASWRTVWWRSRCHGGVRASRRLWRGCSTRTSFLCIPTASTPPAGYTCCACRISAGSHSLASWLTRRFNPPVRVPSWSTPWIGWAAAAGCRLPTRPRGTSFRDDRTPGDRLVVRAARRGPRSCPWPGSAAPRIKPSNVLVTADGMPMLLDFDLAREPVPADRMAADTATLGGTIDYMAPEHLKALGEPSSHAVDGRAISTAWAWCSLRRSRASVRSRRRAGGRRSWRR